MHQTIDLMIAQSQFYAYFDSILCQYIFYICFIPFNFYNQVISTTEHISVIKKLKQLLIEVS